MYTLPLPRWKWYQPSDPQVIQDQILELTNKIVANLGFYELRADLALMQAMKLTAVASMLLGLLFSIIIILFVVVSILLIYSLLMISVETKTFENGVLRLLGLDKYDCISMILIQGFFYVIPAITLAYLGAIPALYGIFGAMFKN
jgi:ABC-type antimicrobial peptide transport system permease subunit